MKSIPVFYSTDMLADSDSRSPSARKPELVVAAWEQASLPIELRSIPPATIEDICLAHDEAFVRAILNRELENGFGNRREDVARSLPHTNGAMIAAATCALEMGIACAPVCGFHHAGYATATMFCTFNGLMIGAAWVLQQHRARRILILDCDYHYGNGTDEIIERLGMADRIENASFGRWYRTEGDASLYLRQLAKVADRFREFDLVIYQAGADVHLDDPLGGLLTTEQMRQRDRTVFEAAKRGEVPLAWTLAGGYQVPVTKVVQLHVATMEECVRAYVAA